MKAGALAILAILLFVVVPFSCRPHPVGSARTTESYVAKAGTSAKAVLSAVQTTALTLDAADKGSLSSYNAGIIGDQEDAITKTQGTFDSIRPPNNAMDEVRDQLDELMTKATDHVSAARIAAQRGDGDALMKQKQPLQSDAKALSDFIEAHK